MTSGSNEIKWSILIPTLPARRNLLTNLLRVLEPQVEKFDDIEVLILEDNRKRDYGSKMQTMIDIAQGEYLNFIDDDDMIPSYYVEKIHPLLDGVDCVGFTGQISIEDGPLRNVFYSVNNKEWYDDDNGYYRNPQHLTPIRTEHVRKIRWDGHYGADRTWSHRMAESGLLKTEHYISDSMYYYYSYADKNRDGVWR